MIRLCRLPGVALLTLLLAGPAWPGDRVEGGYLLRETVAGDTLLNLCERLCVSPWQWRDLARANQIANVHALRPGQVLRIPLDIVRREALPVVVSAVQGDVRVDGRKVWVGAKLAQHSKVETGADGYVTLRLDDGSTLRLRPASQAELQQAERLVGTSLRQARVRIEKGGGEAAVVPNPDSGAGGFVIQTPVAKTAVRGTRFRVGVDAAARTEVLQGAVEVSSPRGGVGVEKAFGTRVEANVAPLPPRPLLPPPDLSSVTSELVAEGGVVEFRALSGAKGYVVEVARDDSFEPILGHAVSASSRVLIANLEPGNYLMRARGVDGIGLEGLDAVAPLTVADPPAPPKLEQTAGEGSSDDGRFALNWDGAATAYWLQVARDASFNDLVLDERGLRETWRAIALDARPARYYWRVASRVREGGLGPFSDARELRVSPLVGDAVVQDLDGDSLRFDWPAGTGRIEFQLAEDREFQRVVASRLSDTGTVSVPRPDRGEFFYRARLVGADGAAGPYSESAPLALHARSHPWWLILLPLALAL